MREQYKPIEMSRSLTPVTSSRDGGESRARANFRTVARPDAAFLSQLLAVRHGTPEYREKRRAEPARAVAAYGALQGLARTVIACNSHSSGIAA